MNLVEKVDTTSTEFLQAIKEHNEQKITEFVQSFDTDTTFGIKVCNHCLFDLLDYENKDDGEAIHDIKFIRQKLRVQKKLNLRAYYPESSDPMLLPTLKNKLENQINGMLCSISITTGWIFNLCEAFKTGEIDATASPMNEVRRSIMKVKHRNNFLRTMLRQYKDEVASALIF